MNMGNVRIEDHLARYEEVLAEASHKGIFPNTRSLQDEPVLSETTVSTKYNCFAMSAFVAYYRVSTDRQGESGSNEESSTENLDLCAVGS